MLLSLCDFCGLALRRQIRDKREKRKVDVSPDGDFFMPQSGFPCGFAAFKIRRRSRHRHFSLFSFHFSLRSRPSKLPTTAVPVKANNPYCAIGKLIFPICSYPISLTSLSSAELSKSKKSFTSGFSQSLGAGRSPSVSNLLSCSRTPSS